MNKIKVLDCTLRDGGYINNWEFGADSARKIYENLVNAKVDYIEIGFLKDGAHNQNNTLYNKISDIDSLFRAIDSKDSKTIMMIDYKNYQKEKITPKNQTTKLDGIRIAFKKHEIREALEDIKRIKNLGYEIFINPQSIEMYSDEELIGLIREINKIKPRAFTIVDTSGVLKEDGVISIFNLINENLEKDIAVCFHSHNNLQLSFSNAQHLIKIRKERELIIDSTIFGMGRGAGNLCSELLTQYLNDHYCAQYDIIPILKVIDEVINPIFAKTPWGYSVPYYLAATNHCHPNYAKYLVDKQTVPVEVINKLLKSIPKEKRSAYKEDIIKQIYLDNFSNLIDDSKTVQKIKEILTGKDILVLAPGKSLTKEYNKVKDYIDKNNPYVISLNFIDKNFKEDMIFVSNMKRISSIKNFKSMLVVTSNIKNPNTENILNYSSYINDSGIFDNVALILLKLLIKINIKKVNFAGLDGFKITQSENYTQDTLFNSKDLENLHSVNTLLKEQLKLFSKNIEINFITNTLLN